MDLGRLLLTAVVSLGIALGGLLPGAPAHAADLAPTTLTLAGPAGHAGATVRLAVDLVSGGQPVAAATVLVDRRVEGTWRPEGELVTDEAGHAELPVELFRDADDNLFRATYAGDGATHAGSVDTATVHLVKRASEVRLTGADQVVDERSLTLDLVWLTGNGERVQGTVKLFSRPAGRDWTLLRTLETGRDGTASVSVRPRVDTAYLARAMGTDWAHRDESPVKHVDNVPPHAPVRLPADAPQPRIKLPRQQRAVGDGPNVAITRIPDAVWRTMVGRSWHRGCPVGRSGLRLVRLNYWGYDGYRYRGELVAAAGAAGQMAGALSTMYRQGFPIRAMYRVDRFGWSDRLQGADDYASMAAGNTSAFNCRWVVGRPGVRSPHTYGRSLDLNTWENPYYSPQGVVPNSYWAGRSHPLVAWRSSAHPVVRVLADHGLRWTYGTRDAHHFDAVRYARVLARGAVAAPEELHPQCGGGPCK